MTLTMSRRTSITAPSKPTISGLTPIPVQTTGQQPSQAHLRHFRASDLQAVRDLFRTGVDTGKASVRREALRRQRFDAINLTLYTLFLVGGFSWFWPSNLHIPFPIPSRITTLGGILSVLALAAFVYRRVMTSRAYITYCNWSMGSSDLVDIVEHYQFKPVNTTAKGCSSGEDVELTSDGVRGFWVVEVDGEVVGCAGLDIHPDQPTHGDLRRMAVSTNHRRYGIGKLLMTKIMDQAREYKLESVTLFTSIYQIPARRLYEKYGFVEEKRWLMSDAFCRVYVLEHRCRL